MDSLAHWLSCVVGCIAIRFYIVALYIAYPFRFEGITFSGERSSVKAPYWCVVKKKASVSALLSDFQYCGELDYLLNG